MRDIYQDIEFLERYALKDYDKTQNGEEGEIYQIALAHTLRAIEEAKKKDDAHGS